MDHSDPTTDDNMTMVRIKRERQNDAIAAFPPTRRSLFASLVVIICVSSLSWQETTSWPAAHAQQQGEGGRQRQNRSTKLHNPKHESTIRNILLPRFKGNSNTNLLSSGNHTSNAAIIVSSSRYWFNYRHATNALSIYHLLKRGGITDDNIVLMLADDMPCNMRNSHRGKIYPRGIGKEDLMENAEVDYSGTDVTVDAFMRVLLGRHLPGEEMLEEGGVLYNHHDHHQRSLPRLDENTNLVVYLTGHGGDNFFKFQDGEELMSHDISSVFSQMYEARRYNEILFISDTCQAFTMADAIDAPNVFSVGSSLKGENSYASHSDADVGQSVIDRYSKVIKDFVDDAVSLTANTSTNQYSLSKHGKIPFDGATVAVMERLTLHDILVRIPTNHGDLGPNSHVGHTDHLCARKINAVPLSDFFASSLVTRAIRDGHQEEGGVTSSIWMGGNTFNNPHIDLRQIDELNRECPLDSVPHQISRRNERRETKEINNTEGMSPTNPQFLIIATGFVLCVTFASRIW